MNAGDRLGEEARRLVPLVEEVARRGPWPLSENFAPGPESEWGPPEVLAHMAEMLEYWREQAELVRAGTGDPVPFGRVQTDPGRLSRIEQHRRLSPEELGKRIAASVDQYRAWFAGLSEDDRTARGVHQTLGEMSLEDMLHRFVVGHLADHVDQLESTLDEGQ